MSIKCSSSVHNYHRGHRPSSAKMQVRTQHSAIGGTSPLHFQRMRYEQCKLGYHKSKSTGTFLGEKSTFMLYFRFHRRDFPENLHIALALPALKTTCLVAITQYLMALYLDN